MHDSDLEKDHHPPATSNTRLQFIGSLFKTLLPCIYYIPPPIYASLPHHDSIRLLRVHPGEREQPLKTSMQLARLESPNELPPYEALSYVWHLQKDLQNGENDITCGRKPKTVGHNLHDALVNIRDRKKTRIIWVDAICINQEDEAEKYHQVHQMHNIYRKATRVLVWIGPDQFGEAEAAFTIMCATANTRQDGERATYDVATDSNGVKREVQCPQSPPPEGAKEWANVTLFFLNVWFQRLWVLQEIVLAKQATFIWGGCSISWTTIRHTIDYIKSKPALIKHMETREFKNANLMHHFSRLGADGQIARQPFLNLMDTTRSFDVTHPKDKIYGLLGFPTDPETGRNEFVFYTRGTFSTEEVYTKATVDVLEQTKNLDILSFTSHIDPDFSVFDNELGLPSWVPNWNSKAVIYPLTGLDDGDKFSAGKFNSSPMTVATKLGETDEKSVDSGSVLYLKGFEVASINAVGIRSSFKVLDESTLDLKNLIRWCFARNNISISDADNFAMTMTGGRDHEGDLVKEVDKQQHTAAFCEFVRSLKLSNTPSAILEYPASSADNKSFSAEMAQRAMWRVCCHRIAFTSGHGRHSFLGLGPAAMKGDDKVVLLHGGQLPYVLRREFDHWKFVGECYVESMMDGSEMQEWMKRTPDTFKLR